MLLSFIFFILLIGPKAHLNSPNFWGTLGLFLPGSSQPILQAQFHPWTAQSQAQQAGLSKAWQGFFSHVHGMAPLCMPLMQREHHAIPSAMHSPTVSASPDHPKRKPSSLVCKVFHHRSHFHQRQSLRRSSPGTSPTRGLPKAMHKPLIPFCDGPLDQIPKLLHTPCNDRPRNKADSLSLFQLPNPVNPHGSLHKNAPKHNATPCMLCT